MSNRAPANGAVIGAAARSPRDIRRGVAGRSGTLPEIASPNQSRPGLFIQECPPAAPYETFGSERLTGALLDRLTHHVNILEMNGDSYRLSRQCHGNGVAQE